ncbi:MAG: M16 family metallopeptidase [Alphaproteobacteria bacterium]
MSVDTGSFGWSTFLERVLRRVFGAAMLVALAACDGAPEEQRATQAPAAPSAAAADAGPSWPHEASDIAVDPAVTWGRLDTGLRYAILPNTTPKKSVSLRLYVAAGSLDETDEIRGMAHFLEHMAFKGSEGLPGDEVVKVLERLGLAFGPDTNAFTSFDQTVYQLDLPEATPELIGEGLRVFREFAGRLTLDAEAIEAERGVILSEMRFRNTPDFRRSKALYGFLLPDHEMLDRFPIGVAKTIRTMTAEDFSRFYARTYRPDAMAVVVVGDVDAEAVEGTLRGVFADFERSAPLAVDAGPALADRLPKTRVGTVSDPDLPTQVQLFGVEPFEDRADTQATRMADLQLSLANAILSRRIATLARRPDAVFLGGGANGFDFLDIAAFSVVSLTTTPDQWRETLAVAEQELRRALEHGFTQAEFDEQIANLETALEDAVNGSATRESSALASGLVGALHGDRVFSTPETELALFRENRDALTVESVTQAFRSRWEPLPIQVFVSGPPTMNGLDAESPEATVLAALEESRAVAVEPKADTDAKAFAYTDFGTPGVVASRERVEDLDLHLVRFENNVRLNIKQTDFEADTITISVRIDGGTVSQPKDKPGLDILTEQVMVSGGLEAHSLDDLVGLFAGRSVGLDFSVGADAFTFQGRTDGDDFTRQLELLAAAVTAPGYRPEAVSRFTKGIEILYETIDATPGGIVRRDVARIIRGDDPRFGLPPRAKIDALDVEDVKAWLGEPLASGHLEIGIVGDIDPDRAIEAVARTFGALPARDTAPADHAEGRMLTFPADRTDPVVLRHAGEPDRALAQIYWKTTDARDRSLSRRLTLLAAVMRLKMTERARRQDGVTYSPNVDAALSTNYPGYGFLVASLDLEPSDTDRYVAIMQDVARSVIQEGITDDEFQRAQNPIVEAVEEQLERNGYWLGSVVSVAQSQPNEIEAARSLLSDYRSITKADVQEAAKTYLSGPRVPVVILPPEGKGDAEIADDAQSGEDAPE